VIKGASTSTVYVTALQRQCPVIGMIEDDSVKVLGNGDLGGGNEGLFKSRVPPPPRQIVERAAELVW
jgi:hypothetical protein